MPDQERRPSASLRAAAAAYLPLLAVAAWAVVARLAGPGPSVWIVAPAAAWLALSALIAAACAAHALLARRWWWGIALVVLWPVSVPLYLWRGVTAT
jgi:hypothetical protein